MRCRKLVCTDVRYPLGLEAPPPIEPYEHPAENFSSTPKMSFTGLKASFYHVRLSAYDENGLEGETGVYDIFYYPPTAQVH
jgi:hypothetical protein